MGPFLAQIRELLQHLAGGAEIEGIGLVGILIFLCRQQHMAVYLVLRLHEVNVSSGAYRLSKPRPQFHHPAVKRPQVVQVPGNGPALFIGPEHIGVVGQRLNFQVIIPGRNALQLPVLPPRHHRLEQLPRLAGGADNEPLPVFINEGFGHDGKTVKVLQMGLRHQLVQISQPGLVFCQHDQVERGPPSSAAPLLPGERPVDLSRPLHPLRPQHGEQR